MCQIEKAYIRMRPDNIVITLCYSDYSGQRCIAVRRHEFIIGNNITRLCSAGGAKDFSPLLTVHGHILGADVDDTAGLTLILT